MNIRRTIRKGFTLVEILIVVVILGILAAVVIPQFTSASESAKGSSLVSQLQTIRSQLELAQIQHNDIYPNLLVDWAEMTAGSTDTNTAGVYDAGTDYGPYLQQAPVNAFAPRLTNTVVAAVGAVGVAWQYDSATGVILPVMNNSQAITAFGDADGDNVGDGLGTLYVVIP